MRKKNTGLFLLVHTVNNRELGRYLVTKARDWVASMHLRTVIRQTEYRLCGRCWLEVASFPGLPCFFFVVVVLRFAFSIIHGSGRAAKNGEGLGTPIT